VAILGADKEGFLRSERSLISDQLAAPARNFNGKAILYMADRNDRGRWERAIGENRTAA